MPLRKTQVLIGTRCGVFPDLARASSTCFRPDLGLGIDVGLEAGSRRDEVADDHVFFETDQGVDPGTERGFGEYIRRLLEACGRDETLAQRGRLGDPEELGAARRGRGLDLLGLAGAGRLTREFS